MDSKSSGAADTTVAIVVNRAAADYSRANQSAVYSKFKSICNNNSGSSYGEIVKVPVSGHVEYTADDKITVGAVAVELRVRIRSREQDQ